MPNYANKWPQYAKEWDAMHVRDSKVAPFTAIAKRLLASKARYKAVEKTTGVPWYMIAVIHEREASQNWRTQLGQGDPLNRVSTHVPRGRGPFKTWEDGAYDALVVQRKLNKVIDWRLEKILYQTEAYNGWGYDAHRVPSAYLWAGSTIYAGGKYVSDGVWSSTAQDTQPGCAALLKIMMELDPSIKPQREGATLKSTAPVVAVVGGGVTWLAYAGQHEWAIALGISVLVATGFYLYYKYRKIT